MFGRRSGNGRGTVASEQDADIGGNSRSKGRNANVGRALYTGC